MTTIKNPFDHLAVKTSDYEKSLIFYDAILAPLGIKRVMPREGACGFGIDRPFFWLRTPEEEQDPTKRAHIAFSAASKKEVDDFYSAGLQAGGTGHGAPDYRKNYTAGYYAAFVLDLDGNNIEAVYRDPNV